MPTEPRHGIAYEEVGDNHYAVIVPRGIDLTKPAPVILYLHGRGESGTDGVRQLFIGLPHAMIDKSELWPFIVIAPQKPTMESEWFDQREWLDKVLAEVEDTYALDPERRYISGLSQGGRGTFRLAGRLAWKFAAAAPVCGWVDPEEAVESLKEVPTWAFHGDADNVVHFSGTTAPIAALEAAGVETKMTIYPGVGHNSWDQAYREPELPKWLLKHKRS